MRVHLCICKCLYCHPHLKYVPVMFFSFINTWSFNVSSLSLSAVSVILLIASTFAGSCFRPSDDIKWPKKVRTFCRKPTFQDSISLIYLSRRLNRFSVFLLLFIILLWIVKFHLEYFGRWNKIIQNIVNFRKNYSFSYHWEILVWSF